MPRQYGICILTCIRVSGSLETSYIYTNNSMDAHDLPSPVLVARIVDCWIEIWMTLTLTADDDFGP